MRANTNDWKIAYTGETGHWSRRLEDSEGRLGLSAAAAEGLVPPAEVDVDEMMPYIEVRCCLAPLHIRTHTGGNQGGPMTG